MILTEIEVIEIVDNPRQKGLVEAAQKSQIDHDRHVSGHDYMKLVKPLKGFEHEDQKEIKKQLAIPATVSIVSEIKNVLNKWQSATDTNKTYLFDNLETEKTFKEDILSGVWKGDSMDYFVNFFLKDGMWNKFNDFLIVNRSHTITKQLGLKSVTFEVKDGVEMQGAETNPYIAHISIHSVRDYLTYGNKVEYIAFKINKADDYCDYKVLDDAYYYTVRKYEDTNKKTEILDDPYKNELSESPCIRLSSLPSIAFPYISTSLLENSIHELDRYVNHDAIHEVSKIMHAFPQKYSIGAKCNYRDDSLDSSNCEGKGKIDIKDGNERKTIMCPNCDGTGWQTVKDASQTFVIPMVYDEGETPNTTAAAPVGYATIDIGVLTFQSDQLADEQNNIKDKVLNKNTLLEASIQQTATAVIENAEPVVLLNIFFAKLISFTEKKLTDWIGEMWSSNKYKGSVINYGLNFANKNDDQITREISEGRNSGLSTSEITELHKNRIKSAYSKDPRKELFQKMLFDLEPFNTLTIEEVENSQSILPIDKMKKLYFFEYIDQIKREKDIEIKIDSKSYKQTYDELYTEIDNLNKIKYELSILPIGNGVEGSSEISEEQLQAQANLRGSVGGVQGILQTQLSVQQGTTDLAAAIELLKEIYGFDDITSKKILGTPNNINNKNDENSTKNEPSNGSKKLMSHLA